MVLLTGSLPGQVLQVGVVMLICGNQGLLNSLGNIGCEILLAADQVEVYAKRLQFWQGHLHDGQLGDAWKDFFSEINPLFLSEYFDG